MTAEDTREHQLDAEEVRIPVSTVSRVRETKKAGGRIAAVGTTVTRALEAAFLRGEVSSPPDDLHFSTGLFISPGFEFQAVDALLTNFHLPRSTLLMLVCAFAGRENVLAAYEDAIREGYLFYSYGDAMFIC